MRKVKTVITLKQAKCTEQYTVTIYPNTWLICAKQLVKSKENYSHKT